MDKNWLDWISPTDDIQVKWANDYLDQKELQTPLDTPYSALLSPYQFLIRRCQNWPDTKQTKELVKRMKGAWAVKKCRHLQEAKGRTNANFVLSNKSKNVLDQLAKRQKMEASQTLELLISDRMGHEAAHRAELKKTKERYADEYRKLEKKRSAAMRAAAEIREELDSCLLEASRLAIALEDAGAVENLSPQQESRAQQIHKQRRVKLANRDTLATARMLRLLKPFLDTEIPETPLQTEGINPTPSEPEQELQQPGTPQNQTHSDENSQTPSENQPNASAPTDQPPNKDGFENNLSRQSQSVRLKRRRITTLDGRAVRYPGDKHDS